MLPGLPARIAAHLQSAEAAAAPPPAGEREGQQEQGVVAPPTLKAAASAAGLHVGTCVMPELLDDPTYAATIEREFTHVVVEHHMKWPNPLPLQFSTLASPLPPPLSPSGR